MNSESWRHVQRLNRVKCYYASLDGVGLHAINSRSALSLGLDHAAFKREIDLWLFTFTKNPLQAAPADFNNQ
ncbi:hypothetical protein [Nitrosospira sp. Nsp18]|uniref:hypothetical protein n=1 Tax=Nitrosospira sp. Nsp18 TaxID=1855334 RepID=UPI00115FD486|nr:hypothetical protein [Nitrosospira sp. Nsp18]